MSAPKDTKANAAAVQPDEDDDVPALEQADTTSKDDKTSALADRVAAQLGAGKQPKRYAKAMARLGLKPEANIMRVQIRKSQGLSFGIAKPEVYRFPSTNTFVIFGETQFEETGSDASKAAAAVTSAPEATTAPAANAAADEDEGEVDASGLQDKEIDIVMTQAGVSRARAVRALKNNNGDIVNSIMELTM
jgi:nascent polypeptide-associated complex subunit alpha